MIGRLFDRGERRVLTGSAAIPPNSLGYGSDSGEVVSETTALQSLTVYSCVRLLADSVAGLPMDGYRKQGDLRRTLSPQPSLIAQPCSDLTNFEFVHQIVTSLALRGNAFGIITQRSSLEYATNIVPVHPDDMTVQCDPNNPSVLTYRYRGEPISRADVLHIRRFTLPGHHMGLSPIAQARQGIGLGLAAERYGARFFGDSANPAGTLSTDQAMTPEQIQETMAVWKATHGGRRNPAFLTGGLKWQAISIMPDESQFLETRQFQRGEIAMMFGVPPHMIGDTEKSTSWGTGIEQQSIGFVTYTLRPWLICIEQALSAQLPRGQYARFNVDALLRGDTLARYQAHQLAIQSGMESINEARALEDMEPIEGGDIHLQPLNFGPLGTEPPMGGNTTGGTDEAGPTPQA